MIEPLLARNTIVYFKSPLSGDEAISTMHPQDAIIVDDWIRANRPLVARMRRSEDSADAVAVGLPLPLNRGKQRISATIKRGLLKSAEMPPLLADVLEVLPHDWRPRLSTLSTNLTAHANGVRVVGSLAWQYITREAYVHEKSDVDILVSVTTAGQLKAVLDFLKSSDLAPGPRVDGEIVAPNGDGLAWRELIGSSKDLLIKTLDGPRICVRDQWMEGIFGHAT